MTQIDGLPFTQLTNLNVEDNLYVAGVPAGGGVSAPLTLSTATDPLVSPLTLIGGATNAQEDYTSINSGLTFTDGDGREMWRMWGSDTTVGTSPHDPGSGNFFAGFEAGQNQPTLTDNVNAGKTNTGIGFHALQQETEGEGNTALGFNALLDLVDASQNTAIGYHALLESNGDNNTAIGWLAMESTLTGTDNVALGMQAFHTATAGSHNIAVGGNALANASGPNHCVMVGFEAGRDLGAAAECVGLGNYALKTAAGSDGNIAIGYEAATILGDEGAASASEDNTIIGTRSAQNLDTGGQNVMVGFEAGINLTGVTASNNHVLLGYHAGSDLTLASNNILIGHNVQATTATTSNWINLGNEIEINRTNGEIFLPNLPTSVGTTGSLYSDGGVLTVSP